MNTIRRVLVAVAAMAMVMTGAVLPAEGGQEQADGQSPVAVQCCSKKEVALTLAVAAGAGLLRVADVAGKPSASAWRQPSGIDRGVRTRLLFGTHEKFADGVSDASYGLSVGGSLIAVFTVDNHARRLPAVRRVIAAWSVTNVSTSLLKKEFARARPGEYHKNAGADIGDGDRFTSMPSGHASGSVAAVVAALSICEMEHCAAESTIKKLLLPAAGLTAILRISADKHYVTDIVAGAALGSAIGWYLPRIRWERKGEHEVTVTPSLAPSTLGVTGLIVW